MARTFLSLPSIDIEAKIDLVFMLSYIFECSNSRKILAPEKIDIRLQMLRSMYINEKMVSEKNTTATTRRGHFRLLN